MPVFHVGISVCPMSCTAVLHWSLFPPPRAFWPRLRSAVRFWQIAAQSSCVLLRDMQSAVPDSYERGEGLLSQADVAMHKQRQARIER